MQKLKLTTMNEKNRKAFINSLTKRYPFLKHKVIAKSCCKRDIDLLKIGRSKKNSTLFVGATHGAEWITTSLLLNFLEEMLSTISSSKKALGVNLRKFFKKHSLTIVPCLNPDGVEIQINGPKAAKKYKHLVEKLYEKNKIWQANARGVDLNHNFDANWKKIHALEKASSITSPSRTKYGGARAFSEPETIAIKKLCKEISFRHVLSFHSQGEEIFWKFSKYTPKRSKLIAELLSSASLYKVSSPTGMAVGAGLKDWFIKEYRRPGFTLEVGRGKNPLPISSLPKIYEDLRDAIILSALI